MPGKIRIGKNIFLGFNEFFDNELSDWKAKVVPQNTSYEPLRKKSKNAYKCSIWLPRWNESYGWVVFCKVWIFFSIRLKAKVSFSYRHFLFKSQNHFFSWPWLTDAPNFNSPNILTHRKLIIRNYKKNVEKLFIEILKNLIVQWQKKSKCKAWKKFDFHSLVCTLVHFYKNP